MENTAPPPPRLIHVGVFYRYCVLLATSPKLVINIAVLPVHTARILIFGTRTPIIITPDHDRYRHKPLICEFSTHASLWYNHHQHHLHRDKSLYILCETPPSARLYIPCATSTLLEYTDFYIFLLFCHTFIIKPPCSNADSDYTAVVILRTPSPLSSYADTFLWCNLKNDYLTRR